MIAEVRRRVEDKLKAYPNRLQHVIGVYETALKLAKIYDVDEKKVSLAALYHDYAKYDSIEQQIELLDLETIKDYIETPVIYHAFAGAAQLEMDFDIHDQDVLNAVRYHVWGRIGMSKLEQIILISDSCEPYRKFDDAKYILDLAKKNLNQATEVVMKASIDYLRTKEMIPADKQIEVYTYYMEVNRGKTE